MRPSFLQRYLHSFSRIEGWFQYDAALLFMKYNQLALKGGTAGDVLEIGVHHGLSTIAVATLRGSGKRLTAIDLFDDRQSENTSASGHGDRARFEENMREFHPDCSFMRVLAQSSGELKPADLGAEFTFCHIDGGHSPQDTFSDLRLCHEISTTGGLIALDDYFNPEYPGVCEGAVEFALRHSRCLRPLIAAYNKVLFQNIGDNTGNLNEAFLLEFQGIEHKIVTLWGTPVILLGAPLREYIDLYASTPERFVRLGSSGPRAVIQPAQDHLKARKGRRMELEVRVENVSSEAFPSGEGVFGLSYHLLDGSGAMLVNDNPRTSLREPLRPGTSCLLRIAVTAPPTPAQYHVEIDLVWEGVMWFKDIGNPTARVALSVV